jgi:histone H3/H4
MPAKSNKRTRVVKTFKNPIKNLAKAKANTVLADKAAVMTDQLIVHVFKKISKAAGDSAFKNRRVTVMPQDVRYAFLEVLTPELADLAIEACVAHDPPKKQKVKKAAVATAVPAVPAPVATPVPAA